MTIRHYIDTADGEEYDPTERTYSVMQLVEEHRVRYVLKAKTDEAIILRHLPLRMKRIIDSCIAMMYPSYSQMSARLNALREGLVDIPWEEVDEDTQKEFLELASMMKPVGQMYALGVIEEPFLANMDDFNQLYERLDDEDRQRLDILVQELTSVRDPRTVDDTALDIANRYNLQIVDREMLENLTVSQAAYFENIISNENKELRRMMNRNEKVVMG